MTFDPYADRLPFADIFTHSSSTTPSVKSEDSPTHPFPFTYPLHLDPTPNRALFRFGMSSDWPKRTTHPNIALDMTAVPFHDDYEDADEAADLPPISSPTSQTQSERIVRRRSSKACDQCRKSKCKCERAADSDACKSCIMLGTPCTFLGPSRKRGPPKGYIDAIEARLHQTEALLGILLAVDAESPEELDSTDSHAKLDPQSPEKADTLHRLLTILRKDTLAREILNRVDSSPYGVRGRKTGSVKSRPHAHTQEISSGIDLHSMHPSNEWQDRVTALLASSFQSKALSRPIHSSTSSPLTASIALNDPHPPRPQPSIQLPLSDGDHVRRQRRRVDGDEGDGHISPRGLSSQRNSSASPSYSSHATPSYVSGGGYASGYMGASTDSDSEDDVTDAVGQLSLNEDEQVRYHGKASGLYLLGFNAKAEARNVGGIWRFPKARVWPLALPPSAQDAPTSPSATFGPLSSNAPNKSPVNASTGHLPLTSAVLDNDLASMLPDPPMQQHLLELYFTYVHSAFPILHKDAFWEEYQSLQNPPTDTPSPSSDLARSSSSPGPEKRRSVFHLLLLTMFAIAARYSPLSSPPPTRSSTPTFSYPTEPTPMWTAGDNFLMLAKNLLDNRYASSHPFTVQSLLLLGYREIGIGAMAQAWAYTGMAVRMAQDLGMHRAADGWARVGMGRLFGSRQLQERRRIWWGCVVLDGYVSTYIGRPLAIFERDYDTHLPDIAESDEQEIWTPHRSSPPGTKEHGYRQSVEITPPVPGYAVSCFNASAALSTILSKIVQSIYSIRTTSSRHAESVRIEGLLDKWYFDLPEHLRFDLRYDSTGNLSAMDNRRALPPNILTLHMQYWCTTLLLHRPFIRQIYLSNKNKLNNADDVEVRAASKKNYELCVGAANHIASIVTFYREKYCLQRAPVFLCFYVFTAAIMHVTSLSVYPTDPQARMGLTRCMDALQDMEAVWPSAARAHELLRGSDPLNKNATKVPQFGQLVTSQSGQERQKRAAEHAADSEDIHKRSQLHVPSPTECALAPPSQPYSQTWRSTQFPISQGTAPDQGGFSGTVPMSTTQSSSYFSWSTPPDGGSYDPFPGTLSTSVLPQMYSTGLIDERRLPQTLTPSHQHGPSRLNPTSGGGHGGYEPTSGGRYPQFWNDYTSFPQMGISYGQSATANTQGHGGLYLNEQYGSIYDNPAPAS